MIYYLDVAFSGKEEKKVKEFYSVMRSKKGIGILAKRYQVKSLEETELLSVEKVQKKRIEQNDIVIGDGEFLFPDTSYEVYYFKASFFTVKMDFDVWKKISGLDCCFKLRDPINRVFINTDVKHLFFKEKFAIYLDSTEYLSKRQVCVEKDFETEQQAIRYINTLGSKHNFASLRQIKMLSERLGENVLFFEKYPYQSFVEQKKEKK